MKLIWSDEALNDLRNIQWFIDEDNIDAAIIFSNKVVEKAESILENPRKGKIVPELQIDNIREILFKSYKIIYMLRNNSIVLLSLFEGHKLFRVSDLKINEL